MDLSVAPALPAEPAPHPDWAAWTPSAPYTIGVEEEVMLLEPATWSLEQRGEEVLGLLPSPLRSQTSPETHQGVLELGTTPHRRVAATAREAGRLRSGLAAAVGCLGLRAAAAGTHPLTTWEQTRLSGAPRYRLVHESMREIARREPTCALHVHVGVPDPELALTLYNRLRAHLPLLLALSANSPFWQGRDTGLAAARIPIFQAFPRVGIPRAFASYEQYVAVVDQLLLCKAIPAPTFLWWDVRLQPSLGTVEVRIMDAQTTVAETAALAALVQTIAHLELERDDDPPAASVVTPELLHENRFLATRDGLEAQLIDPLSQDRVPARVALELLLRRAREHAQQLGCADELAGLQALARENGAIRQRRLTRDRGMTATIGALSALFV